MHVADIELNIIGANGIVGASMGLGVGAASAAKQRKSTDAGIAIFGDGGANEGIFQQRRGRTCDSQFGSAEPIDNSVRGLFPPGTFDEVPHNSVRLTVARRLVEAKQSIPHFYLSADSIIGFSIPRLNAASNLAAVAPSSAR
jgi:pyruvate/2-oxoglutarate dehydrogenase complex dihydrolipoamide acyltransferase (E2) component